MGSIQIPHGGRRNLLALSAGGTWGERGLRDSMMASSGRMALRLAHRLEPARQALREHGGRYGEIAAAQPSEHEIGARDVAIVDRTGDHIGVRRRRPALDVERDQALPGEIAPQELERVRLDDDLELQSGA